MRITALIVFAGWLITSACQKYPPLEEPGSNVFEENSGVELIYPDSSRVVSYPPRITVFYHVDESLFPEGRNFNQVRIFRNGSQAFIQNTNETDRFVDISVASGKTYTYTFQLYQDATFYSKTSKPYVVTIP